MVGFTRACWSKIRKSVADAICSHDGTKLTVQGWLRAVRAQKSRVFASLNDGLSSQTLQLIFASTPENKGLTVNSFVQVSGTLVATPDRPQPVELRCDSLDLVRPCAVQGYPFPARSEPGWTQTRQHVHLRSRVPCCAAVLRMRASVTRALHEHMHRRGFLHVDTPVLTANDCEGAGDVFSVTTARGESADAEDQQPFFGRDAHLTVSGQLHLEAITSGVTHVYSMGPAFRAESSRTHRHLAEFHMLEAELAPVQELALLLQELETLVTEVTRAFMAESAAELELVLPDTWRQQLELLQRLTAAPFVRLTHAEAVAVLERRGETDARPDADLSRQHELALLEHTGQTPVMVTEWPADLKPFYVSRRGHVAAAVDLLVPRVGELAGGSVREQDADRLAARLQRLGLLPELAWYVDLRRYGGPPSAGFGLGVERLLLLLTGLQSARDVVPFPRWHRHCHT